jgi:hypothetical protein
MRPIKRIPHLSSLYSSYKGPSGLRCLLRPNSPITPENIEQLHLDNYGNNNNSSGIEILKSDRRTNIVKFYVNRTPFIAKIFLMHRFKDYLRHRRYAYAEFRNNLFASYLGLSVPLCYGYFEKRKLGLVRQSGVIMKLLSEYTEL